MSHFSRYLKENNEKTLKRCFDQDWEYMKEVAKKYKKSEEADVQAEMFKIYKQLKELYRTQSGYNSNGNVFCINSNQLDLCMN
jgi:uncharacterized pyridoxamine 5'-phosphate oxidase family protein